MKVGDKVFFVSAGVDLHPPSLHKGIITHKRNWSVRSHPFTVRSTTARRGGYIPYIQDIFPRTKTGLAKAKEALVVRVQNKQFAMINFQHALRDEIMKSVRMRV